MPDEGKIAEGVHEDSGDAIAVDGELRGFHLSNELRCGRLQLVHVDALSRRSGRFGGLGRGSLGPPRLPGALSSLFLIPILSFRRKKKGVK